jgi:hypothetical protein
MTITQQIQFDQAYAEYILANVDPSEISICNGDQLTEAMESGLLLEEFSSSLSI